MPLYGYARVSTLDQDLSIQRAALKSAGCEVIRAEKASGMRRDGRTELQVLFRLEMLRSCRLISVNPAKCFSISFVTATRWSSPVSTVWHAR
jgi:hypothetical protein